MKSFKFIFSADATKHPAYKGLNLQRFLCSSELLHTTKNYIKGTPMSPYAVANPTFKELKPKQDSIW